RNAPILLRLDLGAASMPGVSADGAGLRFTTIDGRPLAHEIERWDPRHKRAEVWVVMDVVKGGTRADAIRMYWGGKGGKGDNGGSSSSDGPAVFAASRDFMAVWHMGGAPGLKDRAYLDSGPHAAHGTGVNMAASSAVEGIVAGAQDFEESK